MLYSLRKYSDSKGNEVPEKGDQYVSNIYRHMTKWLIQMKMSIYVRADACVMCVCVCVCTRTYMRVFWVYCIRFTCSRFRYQKSAEVISAVHLYEL